MKTSHLETSAPPKRTGKAQTLGCVSYLNAKPLIEGLERSMDAAVHFAVPSGQLELLESGRVDIALCPVIDYYLSRRPLEIVPVGGIGCLGPTLTVRLYSQVPFQSITQIHADSDSHTSIALLRVILSQTQKSVPPISTYLTQRDKESNNWRSLPSVQSVLLIGDKVVTDHPDNNRYPYQMDLGDAWHRLTGLPFVFAVWMTREGQSLGTLPDTLNHLRVANMSRISDIARRYAPAHCWPVGMATEYLGRYMRYDIGPRQLEAIGRFSAMAYHLGLIDQTPALRVRRACSATPSEQSMTST